MAEITIARMKPGKALEILKSNSAQFIDVRSPLEFGSEHIDNSKNIPLDELGRRSSELKKEQLAILVCRSGKRASMAAEMLSPYGYKVVTLDGGIMGWSKARLPLKEGKKRISIERQTQLSIGLILLASSAAGFLVNTWFFAVPAFMGAGLAFAGFSGTCGLALVIAKAPWNKIATVSLSDTQSTPSCCS